MIKKYFPFLFLFVLTACCKDKSIDFIQGNCFERSKLLLEPSQNNGLDTFPSPHNFFGEYWYVGSRIFGYFEPCFNPSNNNQICYRKINNSTGTWNEICTFDFCTGIEKKITEGNTPSWGVNGWIVYHSTDYHLWKIKANGDSATRLPNSGTLPNWNKDATEIVFQDENGCCVGGSLIKVINNFGVYIDSIPNSLLLSNPIQLAFSNNNKITWTDGGVKTRLSWFDLNNRTYNFKDELAYLTGSGASSVASPEYVKWYNDGINILVGDSWRYYKFNTATNEITDIKVGADNRIYGAMDLSSDNKWIIASRSDSRYIGNDSIESLGSDLYLMRADGSQEMRVKLPK